MFVVPERWPCTLDFGVGLVYAWHDSLICATWLTWRDSCVTWLMCGSTELIHMGYDSFIWDMTYWYVRHDSCDVTPTWHDPNVAGCGSFTCEITPQKRVTPEVVPCAPSHLSTTEQILLKMLHPRSPSKPGTQIPRYELKLNRNLDLNLYREIPKSLSFLDWQICDLQRFQRNPYSAGVFGLCVCKRERATHAHTHTHRAVWDTFRPLHLRASSRMSGDYNTQVSRR